MNEERVPDGKAMKATDSNESPTALRQRPSRLRVVVLFIVSQIVAFSLILEIGGRLFDPMGVSYFPETARLLDQMIHEEPIGYRLPPGLHGTYHGVDVQTNELGMRDRPVASEKDPGEFRILMIGDSVMFSLGVEIEDSIPAQIERIANANASAGRRYRTLNMGVPSYNTEQERVQTETLGVTLQPDAAVLLFVPNDVEDKMWVFDKRSSFAANNAQRSYGLSFLFSAFRPLVTKILERVRSVSQDEPSSDQVAPGSANARFHEIGESLAKINQSLAQISAPLLVVHRAHVDDELIGVIRAVGDREGFSVGTLDVWSDPRWSDDDPSEFVNSRVDSHCNPAGCERNAIVIHELMIATGLLD
jgi:hypothetical protein